MIIMVHIHFHIVLHWAPHLMLHMHKMTCRHFMTKHGCAKKYRQYEDCLQSHETFEPQSNCTTVAIAPEGSKELSRNAIDYALNLCRATRPLFQQGNADIAVESTEINEDAKQQYFGGHHKAV